MGERRHIQTSIGQSASLRGRLATVMRRAPGAWRFGNQPAAAIVVVGWARLLPEFVHLSVWLLLSVLLVDVADLLADCLCMMRLRAYSPLTLRLLSVLRAHGRRDFIVASLAL